MIRDIIDTILFLAIMTGITYLMLSGPNHW